MSDAIGKYFRRKNVEIKVRKNIKNFFSNILHSKVKYSDKKAKKYIDKAVLKFIKTEIYDDIRYKPIVISDCKLFYSDVNVDFYEITFTYSNWNRKYFLDKFRNEIRQFIFEKYEISGYVKKLINNTDDWDWVSKKLIVPFRFRYHDTNLIDSKGVVFYRRNDRKRRRI